MDEILSHKDDKFSKNKYKFDFQCKSKVWVAFKDAIAIIRIAYPSTTLGTGVVLRNTHYAIPILSGDEKI